MINNFAMTWCLLQRYSIYLDNLAPVVVLFLQKVVLMHALLQVKSVDRAISHRKIRSDLKLESTVV